MSGPKKNAAKANGVTNALGLITNHEALLKAIKAVHSMAARLNVQQHLVATSTLLHAAEHGQVAPLNAFYNGLKSSDQTAFKAWVSYLCSDVAHPLGLGEGKGWLRAFDRNKNEKQEDGFFRIINDRKAQRQDFVANIETIYKGTDATKGGTGNKFHNKDVGKFFEQRINGGNVNVFDDKVALSRVTSLVKQMEKEDAKVDPRIVAIMKQALAQVDMLVPHDGEEINANNNPGGNLGNNDGAGVQPLH